MARKHTVAIAIVLTFVIGACGVTVFAENNGNPASAKAVTACPQFTDENQDAVCDNWNVRPSFTDENEDRICDNRTNSAGFTDENEDGICDNRANGTGFIDENEDGVCDNRANVQPGNGCGARRQRCRGRS